MFAVIFSAELIQSHFWLNKCSALSYSKWNLSPISLNSFVCVEIVAF